MLMQLGAVTFDVTPFNMHEHVRETAATFVSKDVLGRRPPLEFVGEGEESFTFEGRLFPQKLGGLERLDVLHDMRQSGTALPLMRGDGVPLGWFVIESVREQSTYLDAAGVGKLVAFTITLKRSDAASPGSIFGIISGLFS
ncbi:MAG: phage tail protein [Alsobacter sp.]